VKIKLDENIGRRGVELLAGAGHDVMTVRDQKVQGAADEDLFDVCVREKRVLITLDHDFGQTLRFPPRKSAGIVVLEPGPRATVGAIVNRLKEFLAASRLHNVSGALRIVEPGRLRVHLDREPR
jgi:predicted nuclease of predicted toxin-antitoxin system